VIDVNLPRTAADAFSVAIHEHFIRVKQLRPNAGAAPVGHEQPGRRPAARTARPLRRTRASCRRGFVLPRELWPDLEFVAGFEIVRVLGRSVRTDKGLRRVDAADLEPCRLSLAVLNPLARYLYLYLR
jgi:hypothetical protein